MPGASTIAALDQAGVDKMLSSAWITPRNVMISNDEVAEFVNQSSARLVGVPFCTQIGHTGPLMPSEVGRPIYLDQVALDFPELVVVAGHIGYPWTEEAIAVASKHENVDIDTSAYTVGRYPSELVAFMQAHGKRKVLFGSNYPMIMPKKALEGLEALGLDDTVKALFLGGNAQRVFKL